jgi:hypothetical protein
MIGAVNARGRRCWRILWGKYFVVGDMAAVATVVPPQLRRRVSQKLFYNFS